MQKQRAEYINVSRQKSMWSRILRGIHLRVAIGILIALLVGGATGLLVPTSVPPTIVSAQFLVEAPGADADWTLVPVPVGTDIWRATSLTYEVEADWYAEIDSHLVRSINGLHDTSELYWTLWLWNEDDAVWDHAQLGADNITLSVDTRIAWLYGTLDAIPQHLEPPGGWTNIAPLSSGERFSEDAMAHMKVVHAMCESAEDTWCVQ